MQKNIIKVFYLFITCVITYLIVNNYFFNKNEKFLLKNYYLLNGNLSTFDDETKNNILKSDMKMNTNDVCLNLTTEECIKYFLDESNIGHEFGIELDWDKEKYFKDKSKRTDSFPFVTGDTFRLICDYVFDQIENTIPNDFNLIDKAKIFVKTDYLRDFFLYYFPNLKKRIILITHNSDYPITEEYKKYLEDSKIIVWFAQNPEILHKKLVPIPIGFVNAHFSKTYYEQLLAIRENYLQSWNERKIKLYLNYNFKTNINARQKYLTLFESLKGVMIMKNRVKFSKYLKHLNNSKFVLCPRGNGLDTHRFYETILMGAIPIVESSAISSIYQNITVLVLSKLTDLTQDMLDNPQKYIKNMNFPKNVVRMETWIKKIYSYD